MRIIQCVVVLFFLMMSAHIHAQDEIKESDLIEFKSDIQRKVSETITQFARRCIPENAAVQHKILELPFMNPKAGKDIFVCFADSTLTDEKPTVYVELLKPWMFDGKLVYEPIFVTGFENGAEGLATVNAVFLANADKDIAKELVIIFSTNMRMYDNATNSWFIEERSEVLIFDNTADPCNLNVCLDEMEILEKKFPVSKMPYTAQAVKAKLKALGFK
ncbi:MAG: hypothetical protein U0U67_02070 [Chitinophagales bacterium]